MKPCRYDGNYDQWLNRSTNVMWPVVSISSDIFFAILPIAILWKLQMSAKRKTYLGALLSLGLL